MVGYEKSRFVDLTREDLDELTCGVCLGVFNDPLETMCCRRTYCATCIDNWLIENNSCPYDRKELTKNELIAGSKITLSLLSKLRIRCEHFESGCQEVLALESLTKHREECRYKVCANCEDVIDKNSDHNCQRRLKSKVSQLEIKVNRLYVGIYRANRVNANLIEVLKKYNISVCVECGKDGHHANACPTSAGPSSQGVNRDVVSGGQSGMGSH